MKPMIVYELGVGWVNNDNACHLDLSNAQLDSLLRRLPEGSFVKFQEYTAHKLVHPSHEMSDLLIKAEPGSRKEFLRIAADAGLRAGCSVFNRQDAIRVAHDYTVHFFKVPSPEAIDTSTLNAYMTSPRCIPLLVSTGGMSNIEITQLIGYLGAHPERGQRRIAVMHCHAEYPQKRFAMEPALLIRSLCSKFGLEFGYSHHSKELWPIEIMVELGASVVEVHIVNDDKDVDANVSFKPDAIEDIEAIVRWGQHNKTFRYDSAATTRRYWITTRALEKGARLESDDVRLCRFPLVEGMDARVPIERLRGKVLTIDVPADCPLTADHLNFHAFYL